ncbi:MAG: TolC family protein [Candidatus Scalindua sp.]
MNLKYIKNEIGFFSRLLLAALFIIVVFTEIALSEDMTKKMAKEVIEEMTKEVIEEMREERNDILKIRWVVDEALRSNPGLKSARLRWDAAKERVPQVRALDDPNFGVTYYGEQGQTRVGELQGGFVASQKIPFYGKLRLRGEVADSEAKAVEEQYNTLERIIIARSKSAFYDLYWVYKSIEVQEENERLLQKFLNVAEVKYASGLVTQQDVLKAQVELSDILNELITLEQMRETAIARVNTLLNRHPETPLGTPEEADIIKLNVSIQELYKKAEHISPELAIVKNLIERDKAAYKLSKKDYYPDFTFSFNYNFINDLPTNVMSSPVGEGRDSYAGSVSINIPIFQKRKYDAGVREATARLKSSKRAYRDVENETLFGVKDFHFRMQTAERLVKLYKGSIIPQAQQSLLAAEIGYQSGRVDFLNLIDSQRILLDFQLAYYRAITDYGINFAELERVVGMDLSRKP